MQLFYNPRLKTDSTTLKFDKEESGHIVKSLRKITGDNLHITNGRGGLFESVIIDDNPNKCRVKIVSFKTAEPRPYQLNLAVAPTKMNERFAWFLEKATEIGVSKIIPIICDHSERKSIKLKRFERVLQSAMKQSLQFYLPELAEPITLSEFIKQDESAQKFIAHCEEEKERFYLKNELRPCLSTSILIGPEGDFSKREIAEALRTSYKPVSLGPNRLRTETAAITACHTASLANY